MEGRALTIFFVSKSEIVKARNSRPYVFALIGHRKASTERERGARGKEKECVRGWNVTLSVVFD